MKPISLKIKGLNSFIEEQNIDFLKLTDRGLFGIFGPTGSGKTTILDGITLGLYGEVSRKSSNFINTNCDKLNIHFEFQISGSENKVYSIDREFKRDKNTGNPKSGKCKLCDITNNEPIILADKVKEVTNKCIEIIGLSLEDFTRTVVLPQGKFSDFLKLEGKNRREMLERLFNLQQFGDDLSYKLGREIIKNRKEYDGLLGEMRGYEDVNSEKLKEAKEEYKKIIEALEIETNSYKEIEKDFNEGKEIWDLQVEINSYIDKEKALKEIATEIQYKEEKVKLAQGALRVLPYIADYENIKENLNINKSKELELKEKVKNLKEEKEIKDNLYKEIKNKKEDQMPILKIKESKAKDALKEKIALESIIEEVKKYTVYKEKLYIDKSKLALNLNSIENDLVNTTILIKEKENIVDNIKIDNLLKERIQKGIILNDKIEETNKRIKNNNKKISFILDKNNKESNNKKEIEDKIILLNKNLLDINKAYENLKSPGEDKDLLKLQEDINKNKDKWSKYNKYTSEIENNKLLINKILKELDLLLIDEDILIKEVDILKKNKKEVEILVLSHKLRMDLAEGNPCPVCGAIHHIKENIIDIEKDNSLELEGNIEIKEDKLKRITEKITVIKTKIRTYEEKITLSSKEIEALGNEFININIGELEEKFNNLYSNINKYKKEKELIEKDLIILKDEISIYNSKLSIANTIIEEGNKQLEAVKLENEDLNTEFNIYKNQINNLVNETNVTDFKEKNKEINEIEINKEKLTKEIKELRDKEQILNKNKEKIQSEVNTLNERIIKGESIIEEKKSIITEKNALIVSKVGEEEDIQAYINIIEKEISDIESSYKIAEANKEEIEKKFSLTNESLITLVSKINELLSREKEEESKLNNILKDEKFEDVDKVKEAIINNWEVEELQKHIDNYKSNILKVKGAIESLEKKRKNRSITEKDWINIKDIKIKKEELINNINNNRIKKEEEISYKEKKLKALESLIEVKDKLDHKIALLNDLEKLFKGKKFVEYVAINRLKYISKDACKRLKEITNENYGLEVDENGKFIIRDYKNGGVGRDASTLSGGETFLASLSLALALSAQIQLKGTAPLELFFLDEGFGTLDDNLLDIVMGSLERIHNDKLKVGIISHVESIKNRVPVKLILSPAESGKGGSKVKIERS